MKGEQPERANGVPDGGKSEAYRIPVKVLLVEDNDAIREMLTRRLERRGYVILPALDGAQGVELALTATPDLLLLDIGLPVLDGLDAARLIKAVPQTSGIRSLH